MIIIQGYYRKTTIIVVCVYGLAGDARPVDGRICIKVFNQDVTVPAFQLAYLHAEFVQCLVLRIWVVGTVIIDSIIQVLGLLAQAVKLVICNHDLGWFCIHHALIMAVFGH
ncbi:MAG: hypothetical protein EBU90_22595 [Proteobacteria bacterium]|nr:hypothetical protein [Pseudomonadota bacterium]